MMTRARNDNKKSFTVIMGEASESEDSDEDDTNLEINRCSSAVPSVQSHISPPTTRSAPNVQCLAVDVVTRQPGEPSGRLTSNRHRHAGQSNSVLSCGKITESLNSLFQVNKYHQYSKENSQRRRRRRRGKSQKQLDRLQQSYSTKSRYENSGKDMSQVSDRYKDYDDDDDDDDDYDTDSKQTDNKFNGKSEKELLALGLNDELQQYHLWKYNKVLHVNINKLSTCPYYKAMKNLETIKQKAVLCQKIILESENEIFNLVNYHFKSSNKINFQFL